MVFENPAGEQHYLTRYWCLKPAIIDKDRRNNGDAFKKPTQYWFIGFEPKYNLVFEPLDFVKNKIVCRSGLSQAERSEIHPQYANRFIRQYLIDEQVKSKRFDSPSRTSSRICSSVSAISYTLTFPDRSSCESALRFSFHASISRASPSISRSAAVKMVSMRSCSSFRNTGIIMDSRSSCPTLKCCAPAALPTIWRRTNCD